MKIFGDILALIEEINDIYLKLYKLECLGEINSGYFFDLTVELKKKIFKEAELFNEFVNCSDYLEIREYLEDEKGSIFLRFKEYVKLYDEINMKFDGEDEEEFAIGLRKLYRSCSKNLYVLCLSLFQECIDTTEMPLMKERLLALKYYNAFTRLNIGEILIENDFQVPKENYVDLYLIADTVKLGEYDTFEIILDSHSNVLTEMLKQFLTISDSQFQDYNVVASSKWIEFMIRACFSMLSTNDYEYIKDNIFMIINEFATNENTKVVDIVEQIMENRMLDKARVRKLSLRPLED